MIFNMKIIFNNQCLKFKKLKYDKNFNKINTNDTSLPKKKNNLIIKVSIQIIYSIFRGNSSWTNFSNSFFFFS